MRSNLVSLLIVLAVIALGAQWAWRSRSSASVYQVDKFALDTAFADVEQRLGRRSRVERSGSSDDQWVSFGNSHSTQFLFNEQHRIFGIRGHSVWLNSRQVLEPRSSYSKVEQLLGKPESTRDSISDSYASLTWLYPKFGLVVVLRGYPGMPQSEMFLDDVYLRRREVVENWR